MSALARDRARAGPPPASFAMPALVALVVFLFSTTLLLIGARSPYTHANLLTGYDPRYDRTEQITVNEVEPYAGVGDAMGAAAADPVQRGARLFVTTGCASCHTLEARGGPVGPAIVGTDEATIAKKVRKGPGGMPQFAPGALSEADIAAIAAYLRSLVGADAQK